MEILMRISPTIFGSVLKLGLPSGLPSKWSDELMNMNSFFNHQKKHPASSDLENFYTTTLRTRLQTAA
jgi:hypothetical protein